MLIDNEPHPLPPPPNNQKGAYIIADCTVKIYLTA